MIGRFSFVVLASLGAILSACQTVEVPEPAVLETTDGASLSKLKAVLAADMGVARVELGAGDLETQSVISVLPPRLGGLETRSLAIPTQFDLLSMNGDCYVVRQGTEKLIPVPSVGCRKVNE